MKTIIKLLSVLMLVSVEVQAQSQSFCFASATSYYEQVYCELQAKGEAKNLPPFYQFKRNDPTTQALLLKRPAARIGIDLPMPKSKAKVVQTTERKLPAPTPRETATGSTAAPATSVTRAASQPMSQAQATLPGVHQGCELTGEEMFCGGQRFRLTGNRRNQRLAAGVLEVENKMALPVFSGSFSDQRAVDAYLAKAYRRYIEQMHAIGLGGVTMTYGKFYFLFFDLQEKGLDFSQRFETMYGFLKKDKATMGVSENLSPNTDLTAADCDSLSEQMLVCSRGGRNYLYLAVSE